MEESLTVIHEGWIDKWTNIMSSWRPRYFKLEPGVLTYSLLEAGPHKETFPIAKCKVRVCPGDPVRLEIETPEQGTLFLRTHTSEEKSRWFAALKQAQMCRREKGAQLPCHASVAIRRRQQHPHSHQHRTRRPQGMLSLCDTASSADVNDRVSESGSEMSPLHCLVESCIACRQHVQYAANDVRTLQSQLIQRVGAIHTQDKSNLPESVKGVAVRLIERVDFLQQVIDRHLSQTEDLVSEETLQRRQLEKSLKWLAKQNYKMEKVQQRSIAAGTPLEPPAPHTRRRHSHDVPDEEQTREARGRREVGRSRRQPGIGEEEESESEVESEGEAEFYECEDNEEAERRTSPVQEAPEVLDKTKTTTHRMTLPKPRTEFKISLWSILKDCLGKDLSRISMPVYFNEPTSFLQRLAEDLQYADIIKQASTVGNSVRRLAMLTVFIASPYASAIGRTYKPFNPLLGETYELSHRGFRFLAEQVGHHPPVTAYHVECDEFVQWGHLIVKTRLSGKSLEVSMPGPVHLLLPTSVDGDHYSYSRAKMLVHNVIFGKLWIELDGTVLTRNHSTGDFSVCQFLRKGWFDKVAHQVRGLVFDKEGRPRYRMGGVWSQELWIERLQTEETSKRMEERIMLCRKSTQPVLCLKPPEEAVPTMRRHSTEVLYEEGDRAVQTDGLAEADLEQLLEDWDVLKAVPGTKEVMWRPDPRPHYAEQFYGFGYMTMQLNELSAEYDPENGAVMPPTDSRFRPDQRRYEEGDTEDAIAQKHRLEEKQRAAARLRTGGEKDYSPRWFERGSDRINGEPAWIYKGGYWESKEKKKFESCTDIFD